MVLSFPTSLFLKVAFILHKAKDDPFVVVVEAVFALDGKWDWKYFEETYFEVG